MKTVWKLSGGPGLRAPTAQVVVVAEGKGGRGGAGRRQPPIPTPGKGRGGGAISVHAENGKQKVEKKGEKKVGKAGGT